jgi:hypothetical protein
MQVEAEHDIALANFRLVGEAKRLLRLGFAGPAAIRLERVRKKLDGSHRINTWLLLAKVYRLMRREVDAARLRSDIANEETLSEEQKKELVWEENCSEMTRLGKCSAILGKATTGNEFFNADYYSESVLWARALGDEIWIKRLPAISQVRKMSTVGMKHTGLMKDILTTLHDCDGNQIPMFRKTELVGDIIAQRAQIDSIDKELLVLVSCVRWLARAGIHRLAAICLAEYQAKSNLLTENKQKDALGIATDLYRAAWFKDFLNSN